MVRSPGPAATKQSPRMGVYKLASRVYQDFYYKLHQHGYPVYQKADGTQFLYVNSYEHWCIGR